jgi:hypothetical protein
MKIQTNTLTDRALDWAATKCGFIEGTARSLIAADVKPYSTDWAQGGPIIEREGISINDTTMRGQGGNFAWCATRIEGPAVSEEYGPTPLVAAMRCYVASQLGHEVEVPEELL